MTVTHKAPRVSVIIPTFNRAKDIPRCLDSLLLQTFKDFEVIICDDGSTDDTAAAVDRYKDKLELTYLWAANFGGPARPRNEGVRRARGKYVAFLDSDDWWLPRKLEESLKYLEKGADLVYHDLYLATGSGRRLFQHKIRTRALTSPAFVDLLVKGNVINNSSVVALRTLLLAIDGFSEDQALIAAEDYDAWLRIAKITDAFARVPQTLGYYWVGGGNLSNPARMLRNLAALEQRYAGELAELRTRHDFFWCNYAQARAHYLLGSYPQAAAQLAAIGGQRAPLFIQLKSLWMLLMMRLRGVQVGN